MKLFQTPKSVVLAFACMLCLSMSCSQSTPRVGKGLEAQSITKDSPGNPVYEVVQGNKKVALITFDWITKTPGTGSVDWLWHELGSSVTIEVKDPEGRIVKITLTDSEGKLTTSGDLDRAKIEMF